MFQKENLLIFDIVWFTLRKMIFKDPTSEDNRKSNNRGEGIMIRCRNRGHFNLKKHSTGIL